MKERDVYFVQVAAHYENAGEGGASEPSGPPFGCRFEGVEPQDL